VNPPMRCLVGERQSRAVVYTSLAATGDAAHQKNRCAPLDWEVTHADLSASDALISAIPSATQVAGFLVETP